MKLVYASAEIEEQCTSVKAAKKLFGGDMVLAKKLLSRRQALESAATIRDIIAQRQFRFHALDNKGRRNLDGYFAIDVKTSKEPWRIILQPLDEHEAPYVPCNIDEISGMVRVVEIAEVSKHYE